MKPIHHCRGFYIATVWALALIFLGSIVHATESSLACPDWPTCFGTMTPEMKGGVFWEHLHRLVAGGLVLVFILATYISWKPESHRPVIRKWGLIGIALLILQSFVGGLTVLMQLPDAISMTHLTLAFLFLTLTTSLSVANSPQWTSGIGPTNGLVGMRWIFLVIATMTFLQSILGGAVRHMDAGLVCPDIPLCLGQWVPPLEATTVVIHFGHRVIGILLLISMSFLALRVIKELEPSIARKLALTAGALVILQVILGFVSVYTQLSVIPVSLHTLIAAIIMVLTVALFVMTWAPRHTLPAPRI
jgi:heme A synthase